MDKQGVHKILVYYSFIFNWMEEFPFPIIYLDKLAYRAGGKVQFSISRMSKLVINIHASALYS